MNLTVRRGADVPFTQLNPANLVANCLPGERALSGGIDVLEEQNGNATGAGQVVESYPLPLTSGATPTGWGGAVTAVTGGLFTARMYVVCAS